MKHMSFGKILPLFFCLVLLSGCKKSDVNGNNPVKDDDAPVAIRLSAGDPSYVKTKAGLEEWNNSDLNVFGLKRKRGTAVGTGVYDFTDATNIVDYQTVAASGTSASLEVYYDETNRSPYYYTEGYVYDFYGYHLGGAIAGDKAVDGDTYSYKVTFDGSNDLMYATTDKAKDIAASGNTEATEAEVYSAWAARREVHPTLLFNHALARMNFIVKGMGEKYGNVSITGVEVKSVNQGTLVVTGPEIGFTADPEASAVTLTLKSADNQALPVTEVTQNSENASLGGEGACIMVAPDMEEIEISVHMQDKQGVALESYRFTAKASDVDRKDEQGNKIPVTAFEAGYGYDFYIRVYGPEEIEISAMVQGWNKGGEYTYDPDDFGYPEKTSCSLPEGSTFNTGIKAALEGNAALTKIRFIADSKTTGTPLGDCGAYLVENGDCLEIHTADSEFKLDANSSTMFYSLPGVTSIDFNSCVNTSDVTNMTYFFSGCKDLKEIDLTGFDTSEVTNMGLMFNECRALTGLDVSGFNTSKVTAMNAMFQQCNALTELDLTGFVTDEVTDMASMFWGCIALKSLDLSGFNTDDVSTLSHMFQACYALESLDISGFDTG